MIRKRVLTCFLFAALASPALAGACNPDGTWQTDSETARLAQVTSKTPIYHEFTATGEACKTAGTCGSQGYLLAGDDVVVTQSAGAWACVSFTSSSGKASWFRAVPLNTLKFKSGPAALGGVWRVEDNVLLLRPDAEELQVRGWAQWPWSSNPDPAVQQQIKGGGVNLGSIEASTPLKPNLTAARFAEGTTAEDCHLNVKILGPYLIAVDNNRCGGHNVTFSGLYRQTSKTVSVKAWQDAARP